MHIPYKPVGQQVVEDLLFHYGYNHRGGHHVNGHFGIEWVEGSKELNHFGEACETVIGKLKEIQNGE